jgi:hypothetical protein
MQHFQAVVNVKAVKEWKAGGYAADLGTIDDP